MAAESSFWKNSQQGTLTLVDGTATPVTLALSTDKGDLKVTGLGDDLNDDVKMVRRGKRGSFAPGERRFPTLTFSVFMGNWVGSSTSAPGTPLEFMTRKGAYAANVPTLGANRRYTFDVRLTVEGTAWGDTADETITFEDCRFTGEFSESIDGNTLTVTCEVWGDVVAVNNTNTVTYSQAA